MAMLSSVARAARLALKTCSHNGQQAGNSLSRQALGRPRDSAGAGLLKRGILSKSWTREVDAAYKTVTRKR